MGECDPWHLFECFCDLRIYTLLILGFLLLSLSLFLLRLFLLSLEDNLACIELLLHLDSSLLFREAFAFLFASFLETLGVNYGFTLQTLIFHLFFLLHLLHLLLVLYLLILLMHTVQHAKNLALSAELLLFFQMNFQSFRVSSALLFVFAVCFIGLLLL